MVYLCHACEGLFDTLLYAKIPSARPITEHLLQSLVTGSVVREIKYLVTRPVCMPSGART